MLAKMMMSLDPGGVFFGFFPGDDSPIKGMKYRKPLRFQGAVSFIQGSHEVTDFLN